MPLVFPSGSAVANGTLEHWLPKGLSERSAELYHQQGLLTCCTELGLNVSVELPGCLFTFLYFTVQCVKDNTSRSGGGAREAEQRTVTQEEDVGTVSSLPQFPLR